MNSTRKLISSGVLAAAISLALFASACGGGGDDDDDDAGSASAEERETEDTSSEDASEEPTEDAEPTETDEATTEPAQGDEPAGGGGGATLLEDDFSTAENDFPEVEEDGASAGYTDESQYSIVVEEAERDFFSFYFFDESYQSLRVEVDVEQTEGAGDQAYFGPICRAENGDRYAFYIAADGAFNIDRIVGDEPTFLLPSQADGGEKSDAINADGPNRVSADCVGSIGGGARLLMYVNGELIADVVDDDPAALTDFNSGGFAVVAFDEAPIAAVFDNLLISTFEEASANGDSEGGLSQEAADYLDDTSIVLRSGASQDTPECFEEGAGASACADAYRSILDDIQSLRPPSQCETPHDLTVEVIEEAIAGDPERLIVTIGGKDSVAGMQEAISECSGG